MVSNAFVLQEGLWTAFSNYFDAVDEIHVSVNDIQGALQYDDDTCDVFL